jgi:hypothetical protein
VHAHAVDDRGTEIGEKDRQRAEVLREDIALRSTVAISLAICARPLRTTSTVIGLTEAGATYFFSSAVTARDAE